MDWCQSIYLYILYILLDPPKGKMLVTLADRPFFATAPYLWNSLSVELRKIQ